jgi:pectinesterase
VVYIDTWLPADLLPQGWSLWGKNPEAPGAYYAEFNSAGPGARPSDRVAWSHQLDAAMAAQFRPEVFLAGSDKWDAESEARALP